MPIAAIRRKALSVVGLAVAEVSSRLTLEASKPARLTLWHICNNFCRGVWELAAPTNSLLAMALWNVEWLVKTHGGTRSVPAFGFLLDQPSAVRMQLINLVRDETAPRTE
jgi:hypothetical protein